MEITLNIYMLLLILIIESFLIVGIFLIVKNNNLKKTGKVRESNRRLIDILLSNEKAFSDFQERVYIIENDRMVLNVSMDNLNDYTITTKAEKLTDNVI